MLHNLEGMSFAACEKGMFRVWNFRTVSPATQRQGASEPVILGALHIVLYPARDSYYPVQQLIRYEQNDHTSFSEYEDVKIQRV